MWVWKEHTWDKEKEMEKKQNLFNLVSPCYIIVLYYAFPKISLIFQNGVGYIRIKYELSVWK